MSDSENEPETQNEGSGTPKRRETVARFVLKDVVRHGAASRGFTDSIVKDDETDAMDRARAYRSAMN